MYTRVQHTLTEVLPLTFSRKNKNALRMSAALTADSLSTTINVGLIYALSQALSGDTTYGGSKNDDGSPANLKVDVLLIYAMIFLLGQLLPKVRNILVSPVRVNVQKELATKLTSKCFNQELDFHVTSPAGFFSQSINSTYTTVDQLVPSIFSSLLPQTLEIAASTGLMAAAYGLIGWLQPAILVVHDLTALYLGNKSEAVRQQTVFNGYMNYGVLLQSIANYRIAHQFGNVSYEIKKSETTLGQSETQYAKLHQANNTVSFVTTSINAFGFVGTLSYATALLKANSVNSYQYGAIVYFAIKLYTGLESRASILSSFLTAVSEFQTLLQFINKPSTVTNAREATELVLNSAPSIEFEKVSFTYSNNKGIKDISFKIDPGQKVALVGDSGSGKSTLIHLLLRFYAPQEGTIKINGEDIRRFKADSLRNHYLVVSQDPMLFNGSLYENIKYGYLPATREEVVLATKTAGLETKKSIDELQVSTSSEKEPAEEMADNAGNSGEKLSGGQRQRAAIARAVLKGGIIALLDEPTSALDPKLEKEINETLTEITSPCTTLTITHRLNTIINSDLIIYMHKGAIVEQGTFKELMTKQGHFFQQFNTQFPSSGIDPNKIGEEAKGNPKPAKLIGTSLWVQHRKAKQAAAHEENPELVVNIKPTHGETQYTQLK